MSCDGVETIVWPAEWSPAVIFNLAAGASFLP